MGIEGPVPYSAVADGLMKTLGIHPEELAKASDEPDFYSNMGLGSATFFDKETFGADKFVRRPGRGAKGDAARAAMAAYPAQAPHSAAERRAVLATEPGDTDTIAGPTADKPKE